MSVDAHNVQYRIFCVFSSGVAKIVETLLTNGAKVDDGFDTTGWTALMYAAERGKKSNFSWINFDFKALLKLFS